MLSRIKNLWAKLESIQSVILFLVVLFAANLLWKISIYGDDSDAQVLLFNSLDISAPFNFMVEHITHFARVIVEFLGYNLQNKSDNEIRFVNDNFITVVWGCTAIKQSFIFLCIMALSRGSLRKKLWYVPLGFFLVYLFNVLRIAIIAMIVESYPRSFHFWHELVFKYLFYGFIFFIWVYWEEKIYKRDKSHKKRTDA